MGRDGREFQSRRRVQVVRKLHVSGVVFVLKMALSVVLALVSVLVLVWVLVLVVLVFVFVSVLVLVLTLVLMVGVGLCFLFFILSTFLFSECCGRLFRRILLVDYLKYFHAKRSPIEYARANVTATQLRRDRQREKK